jgi:hypothetical protein
LINEESFWISAEKRRIADVGDVLHISRDIAFGCENDALFFKVGKN